MKEKMGLKIRYLCVASLMFLFVGSGCLARSYTVVKEREDLAISGNQGYILGVPKEQKEVTDRTRKTYVLEVELGKHAKTVNRSPEGSFTQQGDISREAVVYEGDKTEVGEMSVSVAEDAKVEKVNTYVVQKGDTLEKIAARPEIYGNKKKWYRIFKANEEKLKSPNKIYPGQVLRIPE